MSKISIITPIHCDISQKVDWLDEMVQSVISQTLIDWELVLINDKSPLSLDPVKMKYASDPRLRWFENAENNGPAKTRNTAVALAVSECILPLDSDDLLANSEVLEDMYDTWLVDKTKIIYGNLQTYTRIDNSGKFQRGKVVELGQYTFELAMNLQGLMPVTAMHSKECHHEAGGWKAALVEGLEDVEYWIAAGKRGYCGQKINSTTLVYRWRQESSRSYKLKHVARLFETMQNKIKQMHSDIYNGRFPVACCGKGASVATQVSDPVVMSQQSSVKGIVTTELFDTFGQSVPEKDWIWKQYLGAKQGNFAKISGTTQIQYMIQGSNHIFPIHQKDEAIFRGTVRDKYVNVPDPRERVIEPEPEPVVEIAPTITEIPKPEMSTIVRLDSVASNIVEADIQPMPSVPDDFFLNPEVKTIDELGLSDKLTQTLNDNGWSIDLLAKVIDPSQLSDLPGIGLKRAENIIAKAQELINKT